jgi:salicylate hydroxylase
MMPNQPQRADLLNMLFEIAAPYMKLQLGSRVQSIYAKGLSATLRSGHVLHADLIIGADGVKVSGTQSSGVNFTGT